MRHWVSTRATSGARGPYLHRGIDIWLVYMKRHFRPLIFPRNVEQMENELWRSLDPLTPTLSLRASKEALGSLEAVLKSAVERMGVASVTRICDSFLRDELKSTSLNALLVYYLNKYPDELGEICEHCIAHITPDTVACGVLRGRKVPVSIIPGGLTFDISLGEFYDEWTGSRIWPGAVHLSRILLSHNFDVSDCEVLELGSGLGISGIAALHAGAYRVAFTEYKDSLLDCCRENVATNTPADLVTRASYFNLDWSEFDTSTHEQFIEWNRHRNTMKEMVFIGSELVYDESHPTMVLSILTHLFKFGFSRGIICVMMKPSRSGFSQFRSLLESLPTDSPFRCEILEVTDPVYPDQIAAMFKLYRT
jgi:predicted nicotinamide N-methyase